MVLRAEGVSTLNKHWNFVPTSVGIVNQIGLHDSSLIILPNELGACEEVGGGRIKPSIARLCAREDGHGGRHA